MRDKKLDNLMRQAFGWMEEQKKTKVDRESSQRECLSEETICDYLQARLSSSELDKVENHLSVCSHCRRLLTTIVDLEKAEEAESSSLIKEKIGTAAESLKICLSWIQGHLTLLETNADSLPFWNALQPVLVRGASSGQYSHLQQPLPAIPPLSKIIKEYKIVVQVAKEEKERCEVRCQVAPLIKKPTGLNIRGDLLQAERTLRSYPLQNDAVLFNGIEPGKYKIIIREAEEELANVSLDISGEEME